MKTLLVTTDPRTGFPKLETVNYTPGTEVASMTSFVERPPNSSKDYHSPADGKSFIISVIQGLLMVTLRQEVGEPVDIYLGATEEYQTIIFQDWKPEDTALRGNSGHRSEVSGDTPVVQVVIAIEGATLPIEKA